MLNGLRFSAHWGLGVVLAVYLILAVAHSLVAPLTVGNDEWAHFLYTRFISEHGRLPITLDERQNREETGTKADDPPLYHLLVAVAGVGLEPTRVLRPVDDDPFRQLADNMVVSYAFIVHTGYEIFPYQGEVRLWFMGRLVSMGCGAGIILLTYLTSLTLFPGQRRRALESAGVIAFIPAFVFHTSVMTYDGLGAVFSALFLLAAILAIRSPARWRWWVLMGLLSGLAITTKYTSVLLPVEIVVTAWLAWHKNRNRQAMFAGNMKSSWYFIATRSAVAGLFVILAVSWWFGFIIYYFNTIPQKGPVIGVLEPLLVRGGNDSTATTITAFLLGEQALSVDLPAPTRARNYPELAQTMLDSFWAGRINEKYLLSPWAAWLFGGLALVGLAGVGRVWLKTGSQTRVWLILLLVHSLLVVPLILVRLFNSFDPVEAVQGRHVLLPAATAIPILLQWGWRQWHGRISRMVVAGLLLWSLLGQVGWAMLVYPGPMPVWTDQLPPKNLPEVGLAREPVAGMRLLTAEWHELAGGPSLQTVLWWQLNQKQADDYLVELTLVDQAGAAVSYSLGHPVQGRYPVRAWEAGDVVQDIHWLPLAGTRPGPYRLNLRVLNRQNQPVGEGTAIFLDEIQLMGTGATNRPCAIWVAGRTWLGKNQASPLRLRQSFTVISPRTPHLEPLAGAGPLRFPQAGAGAFHTFVVEPDWNGAYRLKLDQTICQTIWVDLPPRSFFAPEITQKLPANYNNEIQLLGYNLPTRRIQPGQRLPLTLYWQGTAYMGRDYRMFNNLLDSDQRRKGGYDRRARDGYSTILWTPGEVITDAFGIPVTPDAAPGIYTIDLGWYEETGTGAEALPLWGEGRPTGQKSIRLGPVKVGGPPPEVIAANPQPQVALNQSFGGQITLLGYDLQMGEPVSQRISESANGEYPGGHTSADSESPQPPRGASLWDRSLAPLRLVLYWRADTTPTVDYTTFVHLRDAANQNVAQKDNPPAGGRYPTSLWDTGEIIVDEITLPLDGVPPGQYTPVVGLYNFVTGDRLLTPNHPANELALEPVQIANGE